MNPLKSLYTITLAALLAAGVSSKTLQAADSPADFRVGAMQVHREGDRGRPIILIPGLACGGWVWNDTVARLKKDHVLYVVTLAGFDGIPPVKGKLFDLASDSLLQLIRTQHLTRPVLIGHSLGGTLSIQFAEKHSDLISGVVAAEGLAVFPSTEGMGTDQRTQMAEGMRAQLGGATQEEFAGQQKAYMKGMVLSEANAAEIASHTSRSNPAATAQYMAEDLTLDLRPGLAAITVPLLVISPYNAADSGKMGRAMTESEKTAYYKSLMTGPPKLEVISIAPARHFMMYDQPDAFAAALARFLEKLPK